ncbi:MAG: serine hydrolase domain-containing protein [Syntrophobacteraceae bacterium]
MTSKLSIIRAGFVIAVLFATSGYASAQISLDKMLSPYLARYDLPALAAAVVKNGKVVAAGAVGTRRAGEMIPVTIKDRFHLGSDTKAMTALMVSMFIEKGRLDWKSNLAELFPELADSMDSRLRRVTVEQLLSHASGISPDNEAIFEIVAGSFIEEGNLDDMRYSVFRQWSTHALESDPGSRFAYANMNYVIAGIILERLSGRTWEELMFERIFEPLGLKTAGIGPQSSTGVIDAPVGHALVDGKPKAFIAGPAADGPAVMGPAGMAHMSVQDFARWAGWNAGQGKRGPALVKPETLKKLHTPVISTPVKKDHAPGTPRGGGYAMGWGEVEVTWAPVRLIQHGGSNTKNLAHIWIDPGHDFAMVLLTNIGGKKADEAFNTLAPELYRNFAARKAGK